MHLADYIFNLHNVVCYIQNVECFSYLKLKKFVLFFGISNSFL